MDVLQFLSSRLGNTLVKGGSYSDLGLSRLGLILLFPQQSNHCTLVPS